METQFKTLLTVGRVSNLPTVWTNVLAAVILSQASFTLAGEVSFYAISWTLLALSLIYIAGMYLNDAFDADWDRKQGNMRPIAKGDIALKTVWGIGVSLLILSVLVLSAIYALTGSGIHHWYEYLYGFFAALFLAAMIVSYNCYHKQFAHSAFIMGACRLSVYLIAALLLTEITHLVVIAAVSLLLYIAGLTYLAAHEHKNKITRFWPLLLLFSPVFVGLMNGNDEIYFWFFLSFFLASIGKHAYRILFSEKVNVKACIGGLLSAIPLVDGLLLASVNAVIPSLICFVVFLLVPCLHRWVSGT